MQFLIFREPQDNSEEEVKKNIQSLGSVNPF
jgi:hypothetical protein